MAWRALVAAVLLFLLPVATADANTRLCRQLESELASLGKRGNSASSAKARRHDVAIQRQEQQMQKARQQAQRAGCGRSIFGAAIGFCGELAATMQRMERNLTDLKRQRARMGRTNNVREKSRILALIDVNGCREKKRTESLGIASGSGSTGENSPSTTHLPDASGTYRTMCVRTCDGYYFPISWSVSASVFERDQNVCQNMCRGTKVELHYHHVTGQESEDMISVSTGLPYRSLPNAFRYRQAGASLPQGCGCGASAMPDQGYTVIGGDHGNVPSEPEALAKITAPKSAAVAPPPPPIRHGEWNPAERRVRVVGPTFLPDQEEAIDLQAPVRIPDQ